MKRKKVDSQRERRILIACVVSTEFLAKAVKVIDLDQIATPHFRQVAEWCVNYFEEYGEAPKGHIEDIYHAWADENENSDLVESVSDFLEHLSKDYSEDKDLNVPYLLDEVSAFMAKRKLQHLTEELQLNLSQGDVKEAEALVQSYRTVEVGESSDFDPLNDETVWEDAFAESTEPLIDFEGDAGRFFNSALTRDGLIGITAPEKTGKTFWCVEFIMRALMQRRKVAFFEVGDLSKSQILKRMGMRWSRRPLWKRHVGRILIPRAIEIDEAEDAGYTIAARKKIIKDVMSKHSVLRGIAQFKRACGLSSQRKYFLNSVHPTATINVKGIAAILDRWANEHDFIPDVIVIDYADLLAAENPREQDARQRTNETWQALRTLSQKRHALVITPTQAKATAYSKKGKADALLSMEDFSEDKRKLAHVTGMLGLNQTSEEKDIQGMRINWIVLREAPFNINRPLYVGQCLPLGKALCVAKL